MSDNLLLGKKSAVNDEYILKALTYINSKTEAFAAQMYNTSLVIEYLMNLMNEFTLPDGTRPLEIKVEELDKFFKQRTEELQEEMKQALASQLNDSQKLSLDLNDE